MSEEDAVDGGSDGGLFVGVEVVDGFEWEVPFGVVGDVWSLLKMS